MAIEPLGSIMSVQAQGTVQSRPVASQAQTNVTADAAAVWSR